MPDANHISGQIPVYTKSPRSDEENKRYREAYLGLKKKYINPDTYNLLNLKGKAASEKTIKDKYKQFLNDYFNEESQNRLYAKLEKTFKEAFLNC